MKSDFYRYPAFRHKAFVVATILVMLNVFSLVIVLVRRWTTIRGEVVYLLTLGVVGLLLLWCTVLRRQRILHRFLEVRHIEDPGTNSSVAMALSVASDMAIYALFIVSISVSMLLRAAFELSRPH
jgi:hypothetical protein